MLGLHKDTLSFPFPRTEGLPRGPGAGQGLGGRGMRWGGGEACVAIGWLLWLLYAARGGPAFVPLAALRRDGNQESC
jgi:hypothetical protein